jgi:hypothetical protein
MLNLLKIKPMKKLLLSGTALMLSLIANAQSVGITTTGAYDDYSTQLPVTGTGGAGLFWYKGTETGASDSRIVGKQTFTYNTAVATYLSLDFGNDGATPTPNKVNLDLSAMADFEIDVENVSAKRLSVRIVLEDATGKQTQIEPNVSDCAGVADFATPTDGITWPNGDALYPMPAYNGFVLGANSRKVLRFDLSSVPGSVGGRKYVEFGSPAVPANQPSSTYDFDATKVHAILFILNEGNEFRLSNGAVDKESYRFDTLSAAQADYTGSVVFRRFKIGSVLSALPAHAGVGVNEVLAKGALNVYPNPAKDVLNVSFDAASGAVVTMTDIFGRTVYSSNAGVGQNNIAVNTSDLSTGMYLLNVASEKGSISTKVSVK